MKQDSGIRHSSCIVLCLCLLLAVGCVTNTTVVPVSAVPVAAPPAADAPFEPPAPLGPVFAPGQVRELVPGGAIDWSGKTIRARGAGVLDPGNSNRDLAWQMAQRAATVVAQRNLLEIVKGIRVDSDTRVQNLMAEDDSVYQQIEAVVKGARQHGPARYDSLGGTVEIELECDLYGEDGVESVLGPLPAAGPPSGNIAASSLSAAAREFLHQYSVLVLDGSGAGLKPALFPKLYDDSGVLLLDPRELASAGVVQYVGALDQVPDHPDFGQPLVLRARDARGKLRTDIVLDRVEAGTLRGMKDGLEFLATSGRVFVKLAM